MKTKVIAFRVTEQEYNALLFDAARKHMSVTTYVRHALQFGYLMSELQLETKRLEAKAKRDAKKAETNVIE